MAEKQMHLTIAKDMIDCVLVKTMYMIRHSDKEGLEMLNGMRKDLRDALSAVECAENPTHARSRRIAKELRMTGREQELPL